MLRKTTALSFMVVMTLLITLKHPVLGYCLCLDTYFTGGCVCEEQKPVTTNPSSDLSPTSCCSSCENTPREQTPDTPTAPGPCDDCTEHLSIDVGDFVWHSSCDIPSDSETDAKPTAFDHDEAQQRQTIAQTAQPIRGDPPPVIRTGNTPMYLRYGVWRL